MGVVFAGKLVCSVNVLYMAKLGSLDWSTRALEHVIVIGVNRPDLGGTVPLFGALSRCPALTHLCPAFFLHSPTPYKSTCFVCRVVSQARTIT